MGSENKPLPPGKRGLPLLGETLTFLKDGFGFVAERARQHGPVFRTSILGRDTAVITGADASGTFIDQARVKRGGAMPPHVQELFGGPALPTLDGEEHLERKRFVLAGFTRDALAAYLPVMQRLVVSHMDRWTQAGELRLLDAFKRLALETICATIMGLPPGPKVDQLARDYELIQGGFANLPIPLPGTAFTKARAALQRILAIFDENIRDHQARPRDDGLSRILAFRSEKLGRTMTVEEARIELHHVVVAGLIFWAWLVTTVEELDKNSDVRAKALAEIDSLAPGGPLTLETLHKMRYLDQLTMEVRRVSPVVHVFFGKAREELEFKGHTIPAGWMILWGIRSSHMDRAVYTDPEKFDPDRFGPGRAEHEKHEHAFVPNGAGAPTGHKCAGWEFAPCLLKVFIVELLRGYTWSLARQDFGYDWTKLPPEPRGGLRAKVEKRRSQ
jgi:cytochrome P450